MLIDSHCHLNLINTDKTDIFGIIENALNKTVSCFIDISVGINDFFKRRDLTEELLQKYPVFILLSAGIPPYFADKRTPNDIEEVKAQAGNEQRVVAIGEIGLDYYHNYGTKRKQISLFIEQIELANELQLPVIIHTRDSDDDLITILREHRAVKGGIIHCFSSGFPYARKLLDLGFFLSFAGNITYKKSDNIRKVAIGLPEDRYVIETDSPYLSPEGKRGKPNEPANLAITASCIAKLRGISFEEVAHQTTKNAKNVLGLKMNC